MSETADRSGLFGHPRGLFTLFLTELWERFSYYGMRAILLLYMVAPVAAGGLGLDNVKAASIYGAYTGSVYFATIPGGWIADRLLGLRRAVLVGGILIALGHYCLFGAGTPRAVLRRPRSDRAGHGPAEGQRQLDRRPALHRGDDPARRGLLHLLYGDQHGRPRSPFICGWLAQKVGWHWGFGAAAFGMTLGVVQYALGWRRLRGAGELQRPPQGRGRPVGAVAAVTVAAACSSSTPGPGATG